MTMKLDMTLILGLAGLLAISAGLQVRSLSEPQQESNFVTGTFMAQKISCTPIGGRAIASEKLEAPVGSLVLVLL
jgi:hypothetical protein